jgi:DNA-binding HxlR family transcriptional regulator
VITLNKKSFACPVDVTLGLIDGKWKILILSHLNQFGKRGFSEIKSNLPRVSEKMLIQQLKELQRDSLIGKTVISEKPYRVEYFLTEQGRSMSPLFEFLSSWGIGYLKKHNIEYIRDQHLYK